MLVNSTQTYTRRGVVAPDFKALIVSGVETWLITAASSIHGDLRLFCFKLTYSPVQALPVKTDTRQLKEGADAFDPFNPPFPLWSLRCD